MEAIAAAGEGGRQRLPSQRLSLDRLPRLIFLERQNLLPRHLLDQARRWIESQRFGHVLDARQVRQVFEPEANQELFGRRVEEWATDNVLAADDLDQMSLEQCGEHTGRIHAADLGDLERGDRLPV